MQVLPPTVCLVMCLGTRPNISESHSEISTRVPFCIATGHPEPYNVTWIEIGNEQGLALIVFST